MSDSSPRSILETLIILDTKTANLSKRNQFIDVLLARETIDITFLQNMVHGTE